LGLLVSWEKDIVPHKAATEVDRHVGSVLMHRVDDPQKGLYLFFLLLSPASLFPILAIFCCSGLSGSAFAQESSQKSAFSISFGTSSLRNLGSHLMSSVPNFIAYRSRKPNCDGYIRLLLRKN
jgi:hypothetical protein